jgi:hypothetical protein
MRLQIQGTTNFDVAGMRGPVRLRARGVTDFRAEKTLLLDGDQIVRQPTEIVATSRLNAVQCRNNLPGLRGWIVHRIAARRTERAKIQAEWITSKHARERLGPHIDRSIDEQIAAYTQPIMELAKAARTQSTVPALKVRCSTTRDCLDVVALSASENGFEQTQEPDFDASRDVEVHVHLALVREGVKDSTVRPLLQGLMQASASLQGMTVINPVMPRNEATPVTVLRLSEDGNWLIVVWNAAAEPAQGTSKPSATAARSRKSAFTK